MSKNLELLKGLFGEQVTELTEDQTVAISSKLDKLVETRVETKVKFQTEVLEAEAKEKYDTLLNEATSKFEEKISSIETKTVELAESYKSKMVGKVEKVAKDLQEKKEADIAAFKKQIVEKLDKYLELEMEKKIPQTYVEAVAKVSVLEPIVEGVKKSLVENHISFDEKNFGLLKDAREEIVKLREEHANSIKESMELNSELKDLQRSLKISEVCEGLTDTQRERTTKLLESYDVDEIGERFAAIRDIIIEGAEMQEPTAVDTPKDEDESQEQVADGKNKEKVGVIKDGKAVKSVKTESGKVVKTESEDEAEDEEDLQNKVEEEEEVEVDVEKSEIKEWAELFRKQTGLLKG
jgi:hypothetical protein